MRHLYPSCLLLAVSWPLAARAQQPFEQLGVKVEILSLTHGRFPEYFENDSLRRIGSVVYDTRLERVAYLLPPDSLVGRAKSEVTARWLTVDPLAEKDAHISPYVFCRDNAILYQDPDGRAVWISWEVGQDVHRVRYENGKLYNENGSAFTGKNAYVIQTKNQIDHLRTDNKELARRLDVLQDSKFDHTVRMVQENERRTKNVTVPTNPEAAEKGEPSGSTVKYDPNDKTNVRGAERNPRASLAHELLGHGYQYDQGQATEDKTKNGIKLNEVDAVNMENRSRAATGDPQRTTYDGKTIPPQLLDKTPSGTP